MVFLHWQIKVVIIISQQTGEIDADIVLLLRTDLLILLNIAVVIIVVIIVVVVFPIREDVTIPIKTRVPVHVVRVGAGTDRQDASVREAVRVEIAGSGQ